MVMSELRPVRRQRVLLKDEVYEQLRDAIVCGTLAPGEVLNNPDLERWLGVSRTTIRDAMNRLEVAGLVDSSPNRHTRVSELDEDAFVSTARSLSILITGILLHPVTVEPAQLPPPPENLTQTGAVEHLWEVASRLVNHDGDAGLVTIVQEQLLPLLKRDAVSLARPLDIDVHAFAESALCLDAALARTDTHAAACHFQDMARLALWDEDEVARTGTWG